MKTHINKKTASRLLVLFISISIFVSSFSICRALSVVENIDCAKTGGAYKDCKLSDFVKVAINISQIILSLVGILSLLAFIYGGVMFLISGGSSERVTKAKQILLGATIGLVIVFTSYMIIKFALTVMGYPSDWTKGIWVT